MAYRLSALRLRGASEFMRLAPGLALAALVGAIALAVDNAERNILGQPLVGAVVAAIIVGMVIRNVVKLPARVQAGVGFTAKEVLEVAVVLLGATIDVRQVLAAGPILLAVIGAGVVGSLTFSYAFGRMLGLSVKLAALVALANSICGNSAIAAVAPIIRADKKEIASSMALAAVVGVVLVLGLPLLVPLLSLSFYQYGVLAGMTVYAVPQVVAASFPVSQLSGDVATLVKLVRVLFLGPVVLLFSLGTRLQGAATTTAGKRPALVPWFIVGFLALAALRFLGVLPEPLVDSAQQASRLLMVLAMAGLGLGVEFAAVRKVGPRVGLAVSGSLAFLIVLSLVLIFTLRITG